MKQLTTLISALFFLTLGVSHVWALPNCVGARSIAWQNCFGTYTWSDGANYVGEFGNDEFHGQGTFTLSFGRQKIGQWENGKLNGYAKYTIFGFTYQEGIFKDDVFIKKSKLMKKD